VVFEGHETFFILSDFHYSGVINSLLNAKKNFKSEWTLASVSLAIFICMVGTNQGFSGCSISISAFFYFFQKFPAKYQVFLHIQIVPTMYECGKVKKVLGNKCVITIYP